MSTSLMMVSEMSWPLNCRLNILPSISVSATFPTSLGLYPYLQLDSPVYPYFEVYHTSGSQAFVRIEKPLETSIVPSIVISPPRDVDSNLEWNLATPSFPSLDYEESSPSLIVIHVEEVTAVQYTEMEHDVKSTVVVALRPSYPRIDVCKSAMN